MEYFSNGSILEAMNNHNFSLIEIFKIFIGLAAGVFHLHNRNVIHADIALRNCLIDLGGMRMVLADFGLSCRHPAKEPLPYLAPRWASPELSRTAIPTFASDVWALGVTFVELLSGGGVPYYSMKSNAVIDRLSSKEELFHPDINPAWPEGIQNLLQQIFVAEEFRILIKEVASMCQDLKLKCEEH